MVEEKYELGDVKLTVSNGYITTTFLVDGSECIFGPPKDIAGEILPDFRAATTEMGYASPMRYAIEHEISHHIVAWTRGLSHSAIVWDSAHGVGMSLDEPDRSLEEHLVNRLQRFMNYGEEDPYGCLQQHLGVDTPRAARHLLRVSRPWLKLAY